MYNTQKMIEAGQQATRKHPNRDITAAELRAIRDRSGDELDRMADAYLLGVAVGMRIAKAEQTAKQ